VSIKPKNDPVERTSLSVAFTVGLYGAAFGAAGITAEFSILQTCLLSLLLFSGASQFAVVGIMGAGGSAVSAIATATLLGFRNALYGLQLAPILKVTGLKDKRLFLISACAIILALLLTPITPAGIPIITTALLAVIFGWKK